jgi:hypothetical protein
MFGCTIHIEVASGSNYPMVNKTIAHLICFGLSRCTAVICTMLCDEHKSVVYSGLSGLGQDLLNSHQLKKDFKGNSIGAIFHAF